MKMLKYMEISEEYTKKFAVLQNNDLLTKICQF